MKTRITNQRTSRRSFAIGMAMLVGIAVGARAADASVAPIVTPPVDIAANAMTASQISGQSSDHQLSSADVGLAMPLISSDAIVHLPDGQVTGRNGIETFISSLEAEFPGTRIEITGFRTFGNLLVVDWQGVQKGAVVYPGRTLATIENGAINEIRLLNASSLSPIDPPQDTALASSGMFVIMGERGEAIVPELIADSSPQPGFVIVDEQGNVVNPESIPAK